MLIESPVRTPFPGVQICLGTHTRTSAHARKHALTRSHYISLKDYEKALDVLQKQTNLSLYYVYGTQLLLALPEQTVQGMMGVVRYVAQEGSVDDIWFDCDDLRVEPVHTNTPEDDPHGRYLSPSSLLSYRIPSPSLRSSSPPWSFSLFLSRLFPTLGVR